jgi:hypothetical membrane protein
MEAVMHTSHAQLQAAPTTRTSRTARMLAFAGIAGPVGFAVGFLVLGLLHPGYSPVTQQVSDLTAGPYGWAQQANFVVFGLLLLAFAVGLQLGLQPTRASVLGPLLLGGNGVGLVLAGAFPLRQDATGRVYDPVGVHSVNGAIFFASIGIALVALALRLRADPRWRDLAPSTLVTGIALLVGFVAVGTLLRPGGAPLHHWLGLGQRLLVAAWLACIVALAVRLRHLATQPASMASSAAGRAASVTDSTRTAKVAAPDRDATVGPPRWAKAFMLVGVIVLLLLFAVEHLVFERLPGGGMHDMGAHAAPAGPGATRTVQGRVDR